MDKQKNFKEKRKIAIYSIVLNALLSLIKIIGGVLSNSAALFADGIHSLSDLGSSIAVYVGIVISNRKSKDFPYGLYKVENLISLVSAFAIFFAGYEISKQVLFKEIGKLEHLSVALSISSFSAFMTLGYSFYEEKIGKKLNSPSIIADAKHIRTDFYTTFVVLIGILSQYYDLYFLLISSVFVIVLFIFHSGFEILKDALRVLLDASVDNETILQVEDILENEPLIVKVNSIIGRNSGSYKFFELDLVLATNSLIEAHSFSERLKRKIIEQVPFVENVVIHYEAGYRVGRIAVLADENGKLCMHFGKCPKIYLFNKKDNFYDREIIDNPVINEPKHRGISLVKYLHKIGVVCIVIKENHISEPVQYATDEFFIKIITVQHHNIADINIDKLNCW